MIRLLQRLFDPAYLYALNPGPLGRWGIVYVAWAIALLGGLGASLWWQRRSRHTSAKATAWACGAGLAFVGLRILVPRLPGLWPRPHISAQARYLLLEAWTARVWPLSATIVALTIPVVYGLSRLRWPHLLQRHVDALSGIPAPPLPTPQFPNSPIPLSLWQTGTLAILHLSGLAWLWYLADRPIWWALPSLSLLSLLPLLARPRCLRLETLAPLYPSYLCATLYYLLARKLGIDMDQYRAFALPDLWSPWFDVPVVVAASVAFTLTIQLKLILGAQSAPDGHRTSGRLVSVARQAALPALLGLLVVVWLARTVAVHRTHGVTASDPYCYVQMAMDLAETGAPLHNYPLAGLARELGLPTWPAVHIGYHPPFIEDRSPTMWSIGWPVLMVPFYWAGGLNALYFAAPLVSVLALFVTGCLVSEALRDLPFAMRWTVAALTCALVATSPEGSERILVPMADAAAQLFTVLTLWLLLRGRRDRPALHGLLAGASYGMAYWIRHPQLPLGIAALVTALTLWRAGGQRSGRSGVVVGRNRVLSMLLSFGLAAFVVAIPDLLYHERVFGGWLHTESSEWFLISASNVGSSLLTVLRGSFLRRTEFGFILPFALYGVWLLWRRHPRPALILSSGYVAVFLFHLCYAALRPRDLIAILPALYLCAAYGFVAIWQSCQERRNVSSALWLICCSVSLFARSYRTVAMPWRDDVITFGYVRASQYQGFLELHELTPENAVIGSMLNSGAIELHARRAAVHPAPWTEDELWAWTEGLLSRGRPFYVLDDGEEMPGVLARLERRYRVRPIRTLDLPYYAFGGGNIPHLVWLYQVERNL